MATLPEISARVITEAVLPYSPAEEALIANVQGDPHVWAEVTAALYSSKLLKSALKEHADALTLSANASEKHAKSLTCATWCLVAATVGLIGVALLSAITTVIVALIARSS